MAFSSILKNPCPLSALETAMFLPFMAEVLNKPLVSVCYIWANSSNMCSNLQFSLQLHPTSSVKSLLSLLFVLSGLTFCTVPCLPFLLFITFFSNLNSDFCLAGEGWFVASLGRDACSLLPSDPWKSADRTHFYEGWASWYKTSEQDR